MGKVADKAEYWVWMVPETDAAGSSLTKREQARLEELCKRYDRIISELDDKPDQAAIAELDQISLEIDALSKKRKKSVH